MAVRAIDLTALVAVNRFFFLFFFLRILGTDRRFNHEGHEGSRRIARGSYFVFLCVLCG